MVRIFLASAPELRAGPRGQPGFADELPAAASWEAGLVSLPAFSARKLLLGALRLILIGLLLGWLYAWASPHAYPSQGKLGFGYGCLHGALMPMALPSLVMGKDVEIFAPNHSGRGYKLGYILGINICGLVFFGSAFWTPRKPPAKA